MPDRDGFSLRRRLLIRLFGALALLAAGLFAFVHDYAQRAADSAYDQLLLAAALSIADTVRVEGGGIAVDLPYSSLNILAMARRDRVFYKITAPDGGLVTGYEDLPVDVAIPRGDRSGFRNVSYKDVTVRVAALDRLISHPQLSGWVRIAVAQTREERDGLARTILTNAFLPIALAVLVGAGLIWLGVRRALAPLAFIEGVIRARQPNDFSPIAVPPPAEVSQLVNAINTLLARLQGNLNTMQVFLADAAHQIRTPLASLRLQAELAADEPDTEMVRRSVARIHRNAVEASQLTNQLLSHAMVIHRSEALEPKAVDLASLLAQVVQRAEAVSEDAAIRLRIEEDVAEALVPGDAISLHEAFTNLVDNAVKYGGLDGPVDVALAASGPGLRVEVADRGPGVADAEKGRVLERFGRGGAGAGTVGSGLGLAIVKAVADAHDADLTLLDRPGGGLIARLEFPRPTTAVKRGMVPVLLLAALLLWSPREATAAESLHPAPLAAAAGAALDILRIDAVTDLAAMEPLIRDFQAVAPDVTIVYDELTSRELYERTVAVESRADLLISSAADLQVKLVNDGYGQAYVSDATSALPDWANWRDEAFGFTYEPAVIAYNLDLVPPPEAPRSRDALIRLIRENPSRFAGRVATYDLATSGIGYFFASQDSVLFSQFWQLVATLGTARARLVCCTSNVLDMIERGEVLIGYNVLGSYARARINAGARIGIVLPEDYTLILSRVALIPKAAKRADLAGRFIDYLLSERGQKVVAERSVLYALSGTEGEATSAGVRRGTAGPVIPITLSPSLLVFLDRLKRENFLRQWHLAFQAP
ncbi:sensor histidine kinase [Skermanella stibiiresistens]|uniref:sensor histidine kinase n=1 Tax=Skermanella stibiiresistens TaxID=913326 RepID=UPI0004B62698|nr:extracellular solute-binding protein [Skermanella stibiiresistens]